MGLSRREFLQVLAAAAASGLPLGATAKNRDGVDAFYDMPKFGNVRLLHFTDCHAQLLPIYFREPSINIGIGQSVGKPPHLVGEHLLKYYGVKPGSRDAHAFTYLDFEHAAHQYGKVGGFAHLATLVKKLRSEAPGGRSLLLDGGDTWQGSGTALWTRGKDMVGATNQLGVDVMTGHWEFTYHDTETIANINEFKGDFVAQNVFVTDAAAFDYKFADFSGFNENTLRAFKPYTVKNLHGVRVAVIGQAFPYTPIANPRYLFPEWSFGIRDDKMQEVVDQVRSKEKPDVVVIVSHNGMDVDLKMASRVTGVDAIFGGHTHDAVPGVVPVKNAKGTTMVMNSGSNGKFVSVLDLDVRGGKVKGHRFKLLPVFSNLIDPDHAMNAYINKVRAPYLNKLNEKLAVADSVLYRRGNFNGTFDQMICDAMLEVRGADIAFSPGFRWGTSILPGDPITMERVMDQTAITYPKSTLNNLTGKQIKDLLEDIADNLFNKDPYYQQGGDMVRLGGMHYTINPSKNIGHRISDMTLRGKRIDPGKTYLVAGWASIHPQADSLPDIWDVVADYLRDKKTVKINKPNTPIIKGVKGNPGLAYT
ncbi:MAG: thiosulfohydrolase SoxB [Acidiferrobacteraceae bacterium]|jgi:sulfur-oxidizing protein SoxB